ncbi:PREDICTED: hyaluronidase PH-20 [Galeopterus variegatus]|uniref:Hyaluronidase n=1 Tax=Galeopterus variegatus TaxID=482537 RepID=A0ABM0RTA4_GALVR|nr:PREDICTED: hyaluronidase PH-20 [Galeopterus variegatus]
MGVLWFKHIFLENFVESNGLSQTVFTSLLISSCLTLNFRAPPLIPNIPFLWAWNAPTELCFGKSGDSIDLSLFSLVGSPRRDVTRQGVTIFYIDRLGYYPYIDKITGTSVHGGIPQKGSLKDHLEKAEKDIAFYMPTDNVGLAVIDWEEWRPTWIRNWAPKDVYKNQSIELVQQQNIQLSVKEATEIAKVEFEKAAKSFMQETLKLGKLLRPNHLWGYYLFPDCYNYGFNKPNFNGSCYDIERRRNDDLEWLWKESTALFPSIYLNSVSSIRGGALYVRNRVQEAIRVSKVSDAKNPVPVYVYARPVLSDLTMKYLSEVDLVNTLGETVALGASGIVIWGSLGLMRKKKSCLNLEDYMKTTLNPYIINVTLAAKMCSQVLCHEKGVCTRKHWNSSDYLHLNPTNFAIQIGKGGKYTVHGQPTLEDLQQFFEKFQCSCFPNLICKTADIKDIRTIDVCIANGVCIEAFLNSEPSVQPTSWQEKTSLTSENVSLSTSSATKFFVNTLFLTMSSSAVNLSFYILAYVRNRSILNCAF